MRLGFNLQFERIDVVTQHAEKLRPNRVGAIERFRDVIAFEHGGQNAVHGRLAHGGLRCERRKAHRLARLSERFEQVECPLEYLHISRFRFLWRISHNPLLVKETKNTIRPHGVMSC